MEWKVYGAQVQFIYLYIPLKADTLIQLDLQRHALERGEEQLAAMDNDLTRSEWLLHGMKSIWGSGIPLKNYYIYLYL